MKPIRIEATNFVSFEHFKYEFQDGVTALVGLNKTDDNQGSNGSGKALTMDADILTPNGFVKMREIKVGDVILHPSGEYQVVRAIPFHDIDVAYKITFSDGTEVKCNRSHLWKVRLHKDEDWHVIPLEEIMKRSKNEEVFFEVPECLGKSSRKMIAFTCLGEEEQQCITVSGEDGMFVTNNYIPTHNSSMQQAVYFAITGNNYRSSVDKKLIRRGEKEAKVLLDIECPIRKETLSIERILPLKGSSKLNVSLNGKPVELATVKDGNNYILSWIAISPEDLKSYFLICKEYYKSFFKSSNTDKLALISRFINYDFLDGAKDIIQKELDTLSSQKLAIQSKRDRAEGSVDALKQVIEDAVNFDFEADKLFRIEKREGMIKSLKEEIDSFRYEISRADKSIKENNSALEELEDLLKEEEKKKDCLPSTKEIQETIESVKKELGEAKANQNEVLEMKEELSKIHDDLKVSLRKVLVNLSGAITCPKCKHKFLTLKDTTLEQEEKKKVKIGKQEKEVVSEMETLDESLKEYEDLISSFIQIKNEQEDEIDKIRQSAQEINTSIYKINDDIESIKSTISSLERKKKILSEKIESNLIDIKNNEKQIKEIKKEKATKVDVSSQEKQIEDTMLSIAGYDKELSDLDALLFKKKEWIGRFKSFKMYLALEQLKNIQSRANNILKAENSDLRILIEGFKTKADGDTKEEITPYVVRDEAENFWYYSGGERARVEIALIIAIQNMINETNRWGGLQFLSIDEITEGLSKESLYDVIEALEFIQYPILVTTHISNENAKCKTLKIIKENGVSRIEQ